MILKISKNRSYSVPVVERTFDILELLYRARTPLKCREISAQTRVSHTSTYRILRTLLQRGYVEQNLDGEFLVVKSMTKLLSKQRKMEREAEVPTGDAQTTLATQEVIQMLTAILRILNQSGGRSAT